jgi:hypothetical protein
LRGHCDNYFEVTTAGLVGLLYPALVLLLKLALASRG